MMIGVVSNCTSQFSIFHVGLLLVAFWLNPAVGGDSYSIDDLIDACETLNEAQIIEILGKNPSLAKQVGSRSTPLEAAVGGAFERNCQSIVQRLLDAGANPNAQPSDGGDACPLFYAVLRENEELVKLLLRYGADPNWDISIWGSPIHGAFQTGNIKIINLLIRHGADLKLLDQFGENVIHSAAQCKSLSPEVLEAALESGFDINSTSSDDQETPLHIAASYVSGEKTIQCLLNYGANPWLLDSNGNTPIEELLSNREIGRGVPATRQEIRLRVKPPKDYISSVSAFHHAMYGKDYPWLSTMLLMIAAAAVFTTIRIKRKLGRDFAGFGLGDKAPKLRRSIAAGLTALPWLAAAGFSCIVCLIIYWRDPLFQFLFPEILPVIITLSVLYWATIILIYLRKTATQWIGAFLGFILSVVTLILVWIVSYDLLFEFSFPSITCVFLTCGVLAISACLPFGSVLFHTTRYLFSLRKTTKPSPLSTPHAEDFEVKPGWDEASSRK